MSPLDLFLPHQMVSRVADLDWDAWKAKGVKAILFDIDNTLVSYGVAEPDEALCRFLFSLKEQGFFVGLISNNSRERAELFNRKLGFPCVGKAKKPRRAAVRGMLRAHGISPETVLFVGDQLLTDVLVARRLGLFAVTVEPIEKKETPFFRCKRWIEKPLKKRYEKLNAKENRT